MNLRDGNSTSSEILLSRLLGYSYISGSSEGCARTHLFLYRSRSPAPRSWETLGRGRRAGEETPVVTRIWIVSRPGSHCRPATPCQGGRARVSACEAPPFPTSSTISSPP